MSQFSFSQKISINSRDQFLKVSIPLHIMVKNSILPICISFKPLLHGSIILPRPNCCKFRADYLWAVFPNMVSAALGGSHLFLRRFPGADITTGSIALAARGHFLYYLAPCGSAANWIGRRFSINALLQDY